jgi:hypothetical protein
LFSCMLLPIIFGGMLYALYKENWIGAWISAHNTKSRTSRVVQFFSVCIAVVVSRWITITWSSEALDILPFIWKFNFFLIIGSVSILPIALYWEIVILRYLRKRKEVVAAR